LTITADAVVEVRPPAPLPDTLSPGDWETLDQAASESDFWDMLMPSKYVIVSDLSHKLAHDLGVDQRRDDPLTLLLELNAGMYDVFDYVPRSTSVDSPIEEALKARDGVCQDFAHIMITLVRDLGIPCRYVSGYLYTGSEYDDRAAEDASHAWVEAWLPELGWVGFDPTNNILAGERHIRIGVGRDYADVPPTQGVFKGNAESELSVGVQVKITDQLPFEEDQELLPQIEQPAYESMLLQQQQQQQ
jgi:transglutaminase-like putative cysteine protease